jgi:hypothetical protein
MLDLLENATAHPSELAFVPERRRQRASRRSGGSPNRRLHGGLALREARELAGLRIISCEQSGSH